MNLKAIAKCALPQTYTEIRAFLGLVGHYRQFSRGFARITQPSSKHLAGEGARRKLEQVSLSEEALEAFQALKQACMNSPVLPLVITLKTSYSKQILLRWIGGSSFPETRGWTVPPSSLCQPGTHHV